jgi:hypothetical protein
MGDATHTPGPWSPVNGNIVRVTARINGGSEHVPVCGVHKSAAFGGTYERRKIAEANTRLIAAAPDLLEALEGLMDAWANEGKRPGWVKRFGAAKDAARAAIAKAKAGASQ